uniref:Uncharacterized protein n=1 Tax=Isotoma hypocrateriformis TaxID=2010881 RepID=A0A1Z2QTU9_9ASTR|nr:hypothetical protein Is_hyp1Pt0118 [Isotoma hypocrateriformis]ASA34913.1 hypothetical protein Is_hyp1Pt0118 [Isotoma hypocrateriformis]
MTNQNMIQNMTNQNMNMFRLRKIRKDPFCFTTSSFMAHESGTSMIDLAIDEPEYNDDSKPCLSYNSNPCLSDNSNPCLSDNSKPCLSDNSKPCLSDNSKPCLSDNSNPCLSDNSSPCLSRYGHKASRRTATIKKDGNGSLDGNGALSSAKTNENKNLNKKINGKRFPGLETDKLFSQTRETLETGLFCPHGKKYLKKYQRKYSACPHRPKSYESEPQKKYLKKYQQKSYEYNSHYNRDHCTPYSKEHSNSFLKAFYSGRLKGERWMNKKVQRFLKNRIPWKDFEVTISDNLNEAAEQPQTEVNTLYLGFWHGALLRLKTLQLQTKRK